MKRVFLNKFFLLAFSFAVFSQNNSVQLKTTELLSPINADQTPNRGAAEKSCFSFVTGSFSGISCGKSDIYYGGLRTGDDWDWFQTMGVGSRNKIKNLGEKNWTDDFKVPVVEPYSTLKEGEQRHIVVDTSGKDGETGKRGKDGEPGKNADGTYTFKTDDSNKNENQTAANDAKKVKVKSDYQPFEKAILGNMYVIRVVDEANDFYVLFRVDELERGKRCKISWKKIDSPKEIEGF